MQTRLDSFFEALLNIVIGASLSFIAQYFVFPLYHIHIKSSENLQITAWFTVISIVRSYVIRRLCNGKSPVRLLLIAIVSFFVAFVIFNTLYT